MAWCKVGWVAADFRGIITIIKIITIIIIITIILNLEPSEHSPSVNFRIHIIWWCWKTPSVVIGIYRNGEVDTAVNALPLDLAINYHKAREKDHHPLHWWLTNSKMTSSLLYSGDVEGDIQNYRHVGRQAMPIQTTDTRMPMHIGSCPRMVWLKSVQTVLDRTWICITIVQPQPERLCANDLDTPSGNRTQFSIGCHDRKFTRR